MTPLLLALISSSAPVLDPGAVLSVPPHVGIVLSPSETLGVALFLPWVLKVAQEEGAVLRPSQLVVELGAVFRAATSFTARAALRWLREAGSWLALGGGLGMGLDVGKEVREVSSVEVVARLGPGPVGYGLVTGRFELRMDGTTAWMLALGGTYW